MKTKQNIKIRHLILFGKNLGCSSLRMSNYLLLDYLLKLLSIQLPPPTHTHQKKYSVPCGSFKKKKKRSQSAHWIGCYEHPIQCAENMAYVRPINIMARVSASV